MQVTRWCSSLIVGKLIIEWLLSRIISLDYTLLPLMIWSQSGTSLVFSHWLKVSTFPFLLKHSWSYPSFKFCWTPLVWAQMRKTFGNGHLYLGSIGPSCIMISPSLTWGLIQFSNGSRNAPVPSRLKCLGGFCWWTVSILETWCKGDIGTFRMILVFFVSLPCMKTGLISFSHATLAREFRIILEFLGWPNLISLPSWWTQLLRKSSINLSSPR